MVGMRTMDGPDRGAGSVSEPGGGARSPSELFDNLRLRLSQLAENHPSAPQRAEPGGGPRESPPRRPGPADAVPEREQFARPHAVPEHDEVGGPAAAAEGATAADAEGAAEAGERTGAGAGAGGALGALGELDLPGLRGASEAYRPWFMSGEPGAPWWAADENP